MQTLINQKSIEAPGAKNNGGDFGKVPMTHLTKLPCKQKTEDVKVSGARTKGVQPKVQNSTQQSFNQSSDKTFSV